MSRRQTRPVAGSIAKARTGIEGLDEITGGGLPQGRPTLVSGAAGCGKTLFALQFLVSGATRFGEPGVFMAFEETGRELTENARSLGFDLARLERRKRLLIDYVRVERSEIDETGEYDLGGLFVRLGHAIDTLGAKRVVLDTIESLFSGFSNASILRAELRRLFRWLKDRGVTTVITGERGEGQLTRQGLEEYVSDCVILLDHRVDEQRSTRRLRIVKYRGTTHGTNEYPFLIDETGICVMPITTLRLEHKVYRERISTGVEALDGMLSGGYYRGTSVLVSGTAGTGKTSLASQFVASACGRGERCLFFAFEESAATAAAEHALDRDRLRAVAREGPAARPGGARDDATASRCTSRPCSRRSASSNRQVVVVDPITNMLAAGDAREADLLAARLVDFLKSKGITSLYTSLTNVNGTRRRARWGSRRSSTAGCCCASSRPTESATAGCTCSSRAACPTPTRFASSC